MRARLRTHAIARPPLPRGLEISALSGLPLQGITQTRLQRGWAPGRLQALSESLRLCGCVAWACADFASAAIPACSSYPSLCLTSSKHRRAEAQLWNPELPTLDLKAYSTKRRLTTSLHTIGQCGVQAGADTRLLSRRIAVQVFCEEVRSGGGAFYRRFVAASYGALWTVYSELRPMSRHFYEACPCPRNYGSIYQVLLG